MQDVCETYPPLNTLKPVADDIWIIDGPIIRFGPRWFKMPFPTRATIIRLPGGRLFIHSPTPLAAELKAAVIELGAPNWIIGPNRLHYWWIPEWHAAYPGARIFLAREITQQAGDRLTVEGEPLDRSSGYPWDQWIATLPVAGSYMTEVVFFHLPSRTLLLTDLIENFEAKRVRSPLMRLLTWIGGVRDPDGSTPRDMRLTFSRDRAAMKAAVARMIEWDPERIILAHGRWYDCNGRAELERAFRWLG
ncbi:DUF4336 domain-containing protein [Bradyrhizobium mercantei]|uniref:DUF4336 domain-containing protein n=1 Tax=Bradyrhizobium mercantei TaxID=1904807 RepID=UPI000977B30C|nr:DUF4336 domain-containing protein [Bradyrhizobium mercantei]